MSFYNIISITAFTLHNTVHKRLLTKSTRLLVLQQISQIQLKNPIYAFNYHISNMQQTNYYKQTNQHIWV